jgi:hypothetical protein
LKERFNWEIPGIAESSKELYAGVYDSEEEEEEEDGEYAPVIVEL